ncbi:uncharacterized [Tachysurus ichikawai]
MNVSRSSHGLSDVLCIGRRIAGPAEARHGGATEAERDTAHINDFSTQGALSKQSLIIRDTEIEGKLHYRLPKLTL